MLHVDANGARIPSLGLGTWQLRDDTAREIVAAALKSGYRHVDTAQAYDNEAAVGDGIRASGVRRDDVFLTTKVWYDRLAEGDLQRSAEESLKRLGIDRVDLLLVHWPNLDIPLEGTMRALADAKKRGLTRHIGISNFTTKLIEDAVRLCPEPLVVNQVEYHPYLDQSKVHAALRRHGLGLTAYSPLARGAVAKDAAIGAIAKAHGKTQGQVTLRWLVQQDGVIAIPRSANTKRVAENFDIFDFELSEEEMGRIHALARQDGRVVNPGWAADWD